MNDDELKNLEEYEFTHGPMSSSPKPSAPTPPSSSPAATTRKLLAHVKAFDRHCNMVPRAGGRCGPRPGGRGEGRRERRLLIRIGLLVKCF